jgi:polar amino acid transport system substrate-binding protein
MPQGSFMHQIQQRGHLVVGVDQSTLKLGYFNPITSRLEGFDVDMVNQVALAIFGGENPEDEHHIEYRAIASIDRIPLVENGTLDIVADLLTITCDRRQRVRFSTIYLEAHQRTMVRSDSVATSLDQFHGKPVCATEGSTAISTIETHHALAYPVAARTDCLVALQERKVEAIQADDTILNGFRAQDPYTKILEESYTNEPYGMAINRNHPEFVRFVNGVLENMRADGTSQHVYDRWFGELPAISAPALGDPRYCDECLPR